MLKGGRGKIVERGRGWYWKMASPGGWEMGGGTSTTAKRCWKLIS